MIVKPWPNGLASRPQVNASLQNQNLRRVAKRIRKPTRKYTQVAKGRKFPHIQLTCDQLVSTCVGWPNGENLRLLASKFELDQSQRKSTQVVASRCKSTQVGGQTKRKLNASRKLASTNESVWPGLYNC